MSSYLRKSTVCEHDLRTKEDGSLMCQTCWSEWPQLPEILELKNQVEPQPEEELLRSPKKLFRTKELKRRRHK